MGHVFYQDLVDLVSKQLDQLDTCYAEPNKDSGIRRGYVGWDNKSKFARVNVGTYTGKTDKAGRTPDKSVCVMCEATSHAVHLCPVLTSMSVDEHRSKIKALGLCFNCLGCGHRVFDCKSSRRCGDCKSKHHALLHIV